MNYDVYHLAYATDAEAKAAYARLVERIHAAQGLCWPALSHGHGDAYLVVALKETTDPETREEVVGLLESEYHFSDQTEGEANAALLDEVVQHDDSLVVVRPKEEGSGDE